MKLQDNLSAKTLTDFFTKAKKTKILLLGDLCVDIYWQCDMTKSVLSRETPFFPLPVVAERMSLGAAGNVANCIKALGVENLSVVGVAANDWRGHCLRGLLADSHINTDCLFVSDTGFTNAYIKPMQKGYSGTETESSRIDFENASPVSGILEEKIIDALDRKIDDTDMLVVSDQFACGVVTDAVRERLRRYAREKLKITVDSRMRIGEYDGMIIKPNEIEAANAVGMQLPSSFSAEIYRRYADCCAAKTKSSVCMTMGAKGAYVVDRTREPVYMPAIVTTPPVDTVGAGDCYLSAFSTALACGMTMLQAAQLAAVCSAVSVKKIGTTGTATPDEISALYLSNPDVTDEYRDNL